MDIVRSNERLYKIFSKDSIQIATAQASGDRRLTHYCRFCGSNNELHNFCDTYLREGIEVNYYQLLYDCFRIQGHRIDGLICERCVRRLRMTQRFRALVEAALSIPYEFAMSSKIDLRDCLMKKIKGKSNIDLSKKNNNIDNKRKPQRKSIFNLNVQTKRMNIPCSSCKQKYLMLVPFDGWKSFTCSRCKKNGCPRTNLLRNHIPKNNAREASELWDKNEVRGKSRLFTLPKKSSQICKKVSSTSKCHLRPTYLSQILTNRSNKQNMLGNCCNICGRDMKNRDMLDRHMHSHTGQPMYRCDICFKVFNIKSTFQKHYLSHGK